MIEPVNHEEVDPAIPPIGGRGIRVRCLHHLAIDLRSLGIAARSLIGVTRECSEDRLIAMLHNPNARVRAGPMPTVDASDSDMSALAAYLGALGARAANVPAVYPRAPRQADSTTSIFSSISRARGSNSVKSSCLQK
jgi:hypothetical protein